MRCSQLPTSPRRKPTPCVNFFKPHKGGSYRFTKAIASRFAEESISGMALAYWREPGTPKVLSQVPVECVELAARALRSEGYGRVGVWGLSYGSILALLAGICLPDLVSAVIAVSPSDACCEGISATGWRMGASAFTFAGRDIPWVPVEFSLPRVVADSLRRGSLSMHTCYRNKGAAPDATFLPVERIRAPSCSRRPRTTTCGTRRAPAPP